MRWSLPRRTTARTAHLVAGCVQGPPRRGSSEEATSEFRKAGTGVLLALLLVTPNWVSGQGRELAPEVQADRLFLRAEKDVAAKEYYSATVALESLLRLQAMHDLELPRAFWFRHAEAVLSLGDAEQAVESVTQYLHDVGRQGQHYFAALELLDMAEEEVRQREVELRRLEARRRDLAERQRRNVAQAKQQIAVAATPLPRDALASGGYGPELARVASGEFEYFKYDSPPFKRGGHAVTMAVTFAIMRHEVTRAQYRRFVDSARYKPDSERLYGCDGYTPDAKKRSGLTWRNPGFRQAENHPVVCVSVGDASAFARWISSETGFSYRLPTAVEWQYAARAGSASSVFPSRGDGLDYEPCTLGNVGDMSLPDHLANSSSADCDDGTAHTGPVGSFRPNAIGIHDMFGNVAELVLTCSYKGDAILPRLDDPANCKRIDYGPGSYQYASVIAMGGHWLETLGYSAYESVPVNYDMKSGAYGSRRYVRNSRWQVGFRLIRVMQEVERER